MGSHCTTFGRRLHPLHVVATVAVVVCWAESGAGQASTDPPPLTIPSAQTEPLRSPLPGIHNLNRISAHIYSGSEPHGDEGLASLQKLGIKTVVSVDGAKPDVELARKFGLRYVHIPFGYSGIPATAGQSLTRVMRDTQSPVYIHCHHGQHRGPAAAAVACVAAGELASRDRLEILVQAGTSKDYAGLWRDVAAFVPPLADAVLPELVEVAEVGSFAAAMAQIDRHFDNVKLCQAASWQVPLDHQDLVPAHEALLVAEALHEAERNSANGYDEQFHAWLREAEQLATQIRTALDKQQPDIAADNTRQLTQACSRCHAKHRNR